MRGGNYYEYWKSNIDNSKRTAINTRAIWVIISCDTTDSLKLENQKSYPDLQMLINISNQFEISLDTLIKEDSKMVKTIDKERVLGKIKKKNPSLNFLRVQVLELLYLACFHPIPYAEL